jgi:hypothetical protein
MPHNAWGRPTRPSDETPMLEPATCAGHPRVEADLAALRRYHCPGAFALEASHPGVARIQARCGPLCRLRSALATVVNALDQGDAPDLDALDREVWVARQARQTVSPNCLNEAALRHAYTRLLGLAEAVRHWALVGSPGKATP